MTVKIHYNPSTLKVAYNPVIGKLIVSSTIIITFEGVVDCDRASPLDWPSDLNTTFRLTQLVQDFPAYCEWRQVIRGWYIRIRWYKSEPNCGGWIIVKKEDDGGISAISAFQTTTATYDYLVQDNRSVEGYCTGGWNAWGGTATINPQGYGCLFE